MRIFNQNHSGLFIKPIILLSFVFMLSSNLFGPGTGINSGESLIGINVILLATIILFHYFTRYSFLCKQQKNEKGSLKFKEVFQE